MRTKKNKIALAVMGIALVISLVMPFGDAMASKFSNMSYSVDKLKIYMYTSALMQCIESDDDLMETVALKSGVTLSNFLTNPSKKVHIGPMLGDGNGEITCQSVINNLANLDSTDFQKTLYSGSGSIPDILHKVYDWDTVGQGMGITCSYKIYRSDSAANYQIDNNGQDIIYKWPQGYTTNDEYKFTGISPIVIKYDKTSGYIGFDGSYPGMSGNLDSQLKSMLSVPGMENYFFSADQNSSYRKEICKQVIATVKPYSGDTGLLYTFDSTGDFVEAKRISENSITGSVAPATSGDILRRGTGGTSRNPIPASEQLRKNIRQAVFDNADLESDDLKYLMYGYYLTHTCGPLLSIRDDHSEDYNGLDPQNFSISNKNVSQEELSIYVKRDGTDPADLGRSVGDLVRRKYKVVFLSYSKDDEPIKYKFDPTKDSAEYTCNGSDANGLIGIINGLKPASKSVQRIVAEWFGGEDGATGNQIVSAAEAEDALAQAQATEEAFSDVCSKNAHGLGWILCPVISLLREAVNSIYESILQPFLTIRAGLFGDATYSAWQIFQTFSNIVFVIILLVVVLSQLTGIGIDNLGIKRILPRLIVAAVLINMSYIICQVLVDVSNIAGYAIHNMFTALSNAIESPVGNTSGGLVGAAIIDMVIGGAAGALFVTAVMANPITILPMLLALITMLIGIFFTFVILAVRQAGVVVLVVLSPLAFVMYMLPNTNKIFKRWWDIFKSLLLVFPIAGLLMGGGDFAARLLLNLNDTSFFFSLAAMLLSVVPMFFIPTVLKQSLSALGNIGAQISRIGANASKRATGAIANSNAVKDAQKRAAIRKSAGVDWKGNKTLSGRVRDRMADSKKGGVLDKMGLKGMAQRNRAAGTQDYNKMLRGDIEAEYGVDAFNEEAVRANIKAAQFESQMKEFQTQYMLSDTFKTGSRDDIVADAKNIFSSNASDAQKQGMMHALASNKTTRAAFNTMMHDQEFVNSLDDDTILNMKMAAKDDHGTWKEANLGVDEWAKVTEGTKGADGKFTFSNASSRNLSGFDIGVNDKTTSKVSANVLKEMDTDARSSLVRDIESGKITGLNAAKIQLAAADALDKAEKGTMSLNDRDRADFTRMVGNNTYSDLEKRVREAEARDNLEEDTQQKMEDIVNPGPDYKDVTEDIRNYNNGYAQEDQDFNIQQQQQSPQPQPQPQPQTDNSQQPTPPQNPKDDPMIVLGESNVIVRRSEADRIKAIKDEAKRTKVINLLSDRQWSIYHDNAMKPFDNDKFMEDFEKAADWKFNENNYQKFPEKKP